MRCNGGEAMKRLQNTTNKRRSLRKMVETLLFVFAIAISTLSLDSMTVQAATTEVFYPNYDGTVFYWYTDEDYIDYDTHVIIPRIYTCPETGYYSIECYSPAGGNSDISCGGHGGEVVMRDGTRWCRKGGNGSYFKGVIFLNEGDKLFVYCGKEGAHASAPMSNGENTEVAEGGYGEDTIIKRYSPSVVTPALQEHFTWNNITFDENSMIARDGLISGGWYGSETLVQVKGGTGAYCTCFPTGDTHSNGCDGWVPYYSSEFTDVEIQNGVVEHSSNAGWSTGRVVISNAHTHSYTSSVTTQPTCTEKGVRTYTCTCGDFYTEEIPALGHSMGDWYVSVSETCTTKGQNRRNCTRSGCTYYETTERAALGHAWPTGFSYADNNGIANGLAYKNCTRCNIRLDSKWLNRIRVRYQNADGTYGSYSNAVNKYCYSNESISWSRAADATYKYAGTYWTSSAAAKSVDIIVYRNSYTLTLNKGTGISAVSGAGSKLAGASVTINATVKPGYTFKNWTGTFNATTKNYTFNMPAKAVSLTANATPNTDTPYKVNHWIQKVTATSTEHNDTQYELIDTENKTGTTDTKVTPQVKTYEGCIAPATQTVNINGDGSTVVNYFYDRTKVALNIDGEYFSQIYDNTADLCTFDVYINNAKVADDVTDYKNDQILYGSTWEVKDIKPVGGKHYYGVDVN